MLLILPLVIYVLHLSAVFFFFALDRFSTHSFHEVDHQYRRLVDLSHIEGKWLAVFCR